jgi:hypothetical protein
VEHRRKQRGELRGDGLPEGVSGVDLETGRYPDSLIGTYQD